MPNALKKILKTGAASMIVAGIGLAYIHGASSKASRICNNLEVTVKDSISSRFVGTDRIEGIINRKCGKFIDRKCKDINLAQIENTIAAEDVIKTCDAYFTLDGTLHIDITQRKPVIRINTGKGGVYIDKDCYIFPTQKTFTARIPVVDGDVPLDYNECVKMDFSDQKDALWLAKTILLAETVSKDRTWSGKIAQYHYSKDLGMILVPKTGDEKFIFGEIADKEDIERKIRKMEKYYTHIRNRKEYKRIDLRYEGQIICK